jgi:hypothetical protein
VFFSQDVGEIKGIQVPFTISIQTSIQCESMLSYGHNGAICMDATFGTNDMKFHLFTLMGFDDHHTSVPLAWIITSRQIIQDLIEWLKPFKEKMLSHMPHWKPSCFLIDDAPQELKGLRLVLYLIPTLCLFLKMFKNIFHKIFGYFKCNLCFTNPIQSWIFYYICVLIRVVWGMDMVPIYLCCWHVLKAWHLRGNEKIKDVEVRGGIFQNLHDVMYMSINHRETIDEFK